MEPKLHLPIFWSAAVEEHPRSTGNDQPIDVRVVGVDEERTPRCRGSGGGVQLPAGGKR